MLKQWALVELIITGLAIYLSKCGTLAWWQSLLVWNALSGAAAIELTFRTLPRWLHPNSELDKHFPAFARQDI